MGVLACVLRLGFRVGAPLVLVGCVLVCLCVFVWACLSVCRAVVGFVCFFVVAI